MQKRLRLLLAFIMLVFSIYSIFAKNSNPSTSHLHTVINDSTLQLCSTKNMEHSMKDFPAYNIVFPQNKVNTIKITISSTQWDSINNNMKELCGQKFGENMRMDKNPNFSNMNFPPVANTSIDNAPNRPNNSEPPMPGNRKMISGKPAYINVSISFNNEFRNNIGFRLKGNSSLMHSWSEGNYKLPFKLDFAKFKNDSTGIDHANFYGFKKISFSPAFNDPSLIREKLASDIFKLAGVPSAQTAFYKVYIDFGSGLKYCGVYTAVEYPDDQMIKQTFGNKHGNIYKPQSNFSSFNENELEKKNHKKISDYSDIEELTNLINSSLKTKNPSEWRSKLETIFNVDEYIKYLAVNNTILNWDTYGIMAHNFYLYNDSVKKITWIPWDNNEALNGNSEITGTKHDFRPDDKNTDNLRNNMMASRMVNEPMNQNTTLSNKMHKIPQHPGNGNFPGPSRQCVSLSMNEVSDEWPLIKCITDDDLYFSKYKQTLKWFNQQIFKEDEMYRLIDKYYDLISPYVMGKNGECEGYTHLKSESSFIDAQKELKQHIKNRKTLVSDYVN